MVNPTPATHPPKGHGMSSANPPIAPTAVHPPSLSRLTTDYVETEDRIRITGEILNLTEQEAPRTVVLWFTQRLISRLLPHLLKWLENNDVPQGWNQAAQGFVQQAAIAALGPQTAVCREPESETWMVHNIQLTCTPHNAQIGFQSAPNGPEYRARLVLEAQPLRQWLNIVYEQYRRAQWPLSLWPQWLTEARMPDVSEIPALLH